MATCTTTPPIDPSLLPDIPTDTVTTEDITDGTLGGTGTYDQFMVAITASLEQEYNKQRIRGTEYSKVYLGAIQAAMGQAVAFVLAKDKAAAEAELARYQMYKTAAETALLDKQNCLIDAQILKVEAEVLEIVERTKLTVWKTNTERAQTTPYYDEALTQLVDLDSVIGRQKKVNHRQADGFLRDAEQKAAKIAGDAFSVQYSVNDALTDVPQHFETAGNAGVNQIVDRMVQGTQNVPE